jgi:hypothetical protein
MKSWIVAFYAVLVPAVLVPALLLAQTSGTWTEEQVQALLQKVREGRNFDEGHTYPAAGVQIAGFEVEDGAHYIIDAKAHLCYFAVRQSVTLVPCKSVKRGYPLLAPLITWED